MNEWTIEWEYQGMDPTLVEVLRGWIWIKFALQDPTQHEYRPYITWSLTGAEGKVYIYDAGYASEDIIWYQNTADAVYAKLAWGGTQ